MKVDLFGWEIDFYEHQFGLWFFEFTIASGIPRGLFLIYYSRVGGLYFDLFWFNILKGNE